MWPDEWFGSDGKPLYKRFVIRLWRSLYGHPEAGSHWERHLEKERLAMSATKISEFPSTYVVDEYGGLALIVYVDDFALSGDSRWHNRFWEDLSKRVIIDEVGDIGRFLGRHHATIKCEGHERFASQLTGMPNFKNAHTPFLSKVAEKLDEEEPVGRLSSSASSTLMKLMWISRLARPDLLRATTWLAIRFMLGRLRVMDTFTELCPTFIRLKILFCLVGLLIQRSHSMSRCLLMLIFAEMKITVF